MGGQKNISDHLEWPLAVGWWELGIDHPQILSIELDFKSSMVLPHMIGGAGLGNGHHASLPKQPSERNLKPADPVLVSDGL